MSSTNGQLPDSASLPASAQPFLFSPEIVESITEAESRGEYTLERIKERRPGLIDAIIELRSRGEGQMSISRLLGCHHRVVAKVEIAYPEAIATATLKRVSKLNSTADKLVEQISDNPDCVPGHAKALAASQLYDKAELLAGRANVRVEVVEKVDIYSDWPAFVETMLSECKSADAEEIPSGTGSEAENFLAITAGEADAGRAAEANSRNGK